jgi:hypothetical protein
MTTFFRDTANNFFLGNASFDSLNTNLISTVKTNNFYDNLLFFLARSGWYVDFVTFEPALRQHFRTLAPTSILIGSNQETTIRRRRIVISFVGNSPPLNLHSDFGVPLSSNFTAQITTNRVMTIGNNLASGQINTNARGYVANTDDTQFNFLGVSTGDSFGLMISQPRPTIGTELFTKNSYEFRYVAVLENHNATILGNNLVNRYLFLTSVFNGTSIPHSSGYYNFANENAGQNIICGKVFAPSGEIRIGQNLDAFYPYNNLGDIQWATDFIVYNEAGQILGKAKNLKVGNGYYEPLKPITLTNYSESGNNAWLPVGILGGKTILMRIHSSEIFNNGVVSVPLANTINPRYCPIVPPY